MKKYNLFVSEGHELAAFRMNTIFHLFRLHRGSTCLIKMCLPCTNH